MMYNYNKVTKTIAHVFVNSKCLDVTYKNSQERGIRAHQLFDEVLEFDQVYKYKNPSSIKIKEVFNKIKTEVSEFEAQIKKR